MHRPLFLLIELISPSRQYSNRNSYIFDHWLMLYDTSPLSFSILLSPFQPWEKLWKIYAAKSNRTSKKRNIKCSFQSRFHFIKLPKRIWNFLPIRSLSTGEIRQWQILLVNNRILNFFPFHKQTDANNVGK